jgi:hypothetical protein
MKKADFKVAGSLIEEGFKTASVVNPPGQQFKLGEKSFFVWKSIRGQKSNDAIIDCFTQRFNLGRDEAQTEFNAIIEQLQKIKLLS